MPKHYEKIGLPQRLYQTLCRLTGETAPHLVVAVSGGKDSMALLYALSEEARQKDVHCVLFTSTMGFENRAGTRRCW